MAIAAEALLRLKTVFDGSGIDRASRAIGELQNQAGSTRTPLGRVSQGLNNVGRAGARAAVGGVAATGAGLAYSAVKAVQFEDSLSDIKKALQLKVNSPQFKKLGDDFLKLSRNVPVAANELSELGGLAALAGKDSSAEILKFAGNTAKLGVAFRMPGREAAESFLAIQAQLGLTDEKTMDLMGTVNKLSDTFPGKVEAQDILKGFQAGLGGVGKMAGMTGEQTAGFYSAFLAAGTPSDAAATAMKNFLNSLTGGSSLSNEKKAALGQLYGMPVDPVRKQLNDELAQINKQITGGLDGVGQQRSEAIENLIDEARSQGRKFIEFEGQTLSLSQAGIIKKKLNEETSAYTKGLKERAKEIKAQLKSMPSGGDLVASDLAKRIQADPEGTITDILQRIKQLPKDQQAGIVNEIFGKESQLGISAILSNIGLVKQGFDVAGKATENASSWLTEYNSQLENSSSQFKLLRNAFDEMAIRIGQALLPVLTQAMRDLTPTIIELIPAVVELAKTGLPLLVQGLKAVLPSVQRFAAWAKENPQGLRDLIGTIGKVTTAFIALGVAAGALRSIGTVIGVLRTVGAVLKTAFAGKGAATAAAGGAGFFTPLINAAKGLGAKVLGPVRSLISALKIAFTGLTLKEVFPGVAEKLQKLRQMFGGKAGKPAFDISQAANNIRRTQPVNAIKPFARIPPPMPPMPWLARMGQAVMSLLPVLATVGRAVLAFFSGPVGWITLLGTAAFAAYTFRDKLAPIFQGIGSFWNTYVVTPIRNGWTGLVGWFGTTMTNVGAGLGAAWQSISSFFNTYVIVPIKAMWDGFKFYVVDTIAAFFIVGWNKVSSGFMTYVVTPIQKMWSGLVNILSSVGNRLSSIWNTVSTNFMTYVVTPIQTMWTDFTTWLGYGIEYLKGLFRVIWDGIATAFHTWVVVPIQTAWNTFTQWLINTSQPLREWLSTMWQGVSQGFYTNVVQPIQEGWDGLTQWLSSTVGSVRGWFGSMWDGLAEGFSTQIATPVQNIWNGVLDFVQTGWTNTSNWFRQMFINVTHFFRSNLVVPIRNMWDGLVSGIRGMIDTTFGWLRNLGNSAVNRINAVRQAAGFQPIQGFARGGHVSGPTLAWVGEGGDPGGEYIIPAKKMAAASMAYLSGARGASVIPGFAKGGYVGDVGGKTKSRKSSVSFGSPSIESQLKNLDANAKGIGRSGRNTLARSLAYQVARANIINPPKRGKMSSFGVDVGVSDLAEELAPKLATSLTGSKSSGAPVTAKSALESVMDKVGPINTPINSQPSSVANDRPINITTGPVLEFDGKRYVTWTDFERGLRDVKRQTLGEIRTAAGRKATGR